METRTVKTIRIFLASSSELHDDRVAFADFIGRLQNHYESRNNSLLLKKWEYLDSAYNNRRKQDEYNEVIRMCDLFVVIFHTKVGKYTLEEFDIALEECRKRRLPLLIYFKDLSMSEESEEISKLKKRIDKELKHFWDTYDNNDKLHLNFFLWLDSFLYGSTSELKVANNKVAIGNVEVADMSKLSFVVNNDTYQQLDLRIQLLEEDIDNLRQNIQKYPNDKQFAEQLSRKVIDRDNLLVELERQQNALLGTAKRIAEVRREKISEKFMDAIEAFEEGHLDVANRLLDELKQEGHRLAKDVSTKHEQLHEHIEALRMQAKTIMANAQIDIKKRVSRVKEIYAQANEWSILSNYNTTRYIHLLSDYAKFLYDNACYEQAENIYLRQIKLSEELYGSDHPATATTYNNIGLVYYSRGDYDKALKFYTLALTINERVYGKNHLSTAANYNNIGGVNLSKGDYSQAISFFFKALIIFEEILGTDHPDAAKSYNNLGIVYSRISDYSKSLDYHLKALEISKKVYGIDNPDTAIYYNTIGMVYYNLKDYKESMEFLNKSLAIREKIYGLDHPSTATSYNNIGMVYHCLHEYDKALDFYKKAQIIYERVYGSNNNLTATSYNNKATVLASMGAYASALVYFNMAVTIREKVLGANHPDTKQTRKLIEEVKKMMKR